MTPDQITEAVQRIAQLRRHFELVAKTGSKHERPIAVLDAEALALAQQALREWVSRADRENALREYGKAIHLRHLGEHGAALFLGDADRCRIEACSQSRVELSAAQRARKRG